jgi:hypothetical protein
MTHCSDYEVELSALLDGESEPAMALKLVDHIASCSSCSTFVRELRATQTFIDNLQMARTPETEPAVAVPIEPKRRRMLGLRPRWAVGLAALLIVTVSVWFGADIGAPTGLTNDLRDGELVIRLEEDKGRMSNERFVALVSELLRADRRYQNQMYVVLDEITQNRASGESRFPGNSNGAGEYDDADRNESSSPLTAAME